MSTNSANDITIILPHISLQLNRIIPIIQIILGTFGNIMNILIFTRRSLRTNPCSLYFLTSSINNIFVLYVATLTRLLSSGWNIDPTNSNVVLCKLRIFFVYTSLALIQWYVVLASIDRYLSSCRNARYRQMSSTSIARKAIILTTIIIALTHFHTFIWWKVDYIGTKTYCNIFEYAYEMAFQIFFLILTCILPPFLMTVFGILTILNVKKLRSHVAPQNNDARAERLRSKDRQMILMLLIQVLVTIFCTLPFSIANIIAMIVEYSITLSDYNDAINTFYGNLSRLVNYFNPVVGFYIYTLSSRTFRTEMKSMIVEGLKFFLTKLGLEHYIPFGRQGQDRSTAPAQTVLTVVRAKKKNQSPMHLEKASETSRK